MTRCSGKKTTPRSTRAIQRFLGATTSSSTASSSVRHRRDRRARARPRAHRHLLARPTPLAVCGELDDLRRAFDAGRVRARRALRGRPLGDRACVTEKLGDVGQSLHTGRSRNDQVLVALRLYLRDALAHARRRTRRASPRRASIAPRPTRDADARATRTCSARCPRRSASGSAASPRRSSTTRSRARSLARLVDAVPLGTARRLRREPPARSRGRRAAARLRARADEPSYAQNCARANSSSSGRRARARRSSTCAGSPGTCRSSRRPSSGS